MAIKPAALRAAVGRVERYMDECGITPHIRKGALVALSGGADSVLLLHILAHLSARDGFALHAVHVHHHLRGGEADRDAEFCRALCRRLGVGFTLLDVDVPAEMRRLGTGAEETARRLRYLALRRELAAHTELSCIVTAHHATDHLETVLFQMLRGGAAGALIGIRPVRPPVVRPLLCLTRGEVEAALAAEGIDYVTDSTNLSIAYARNFIRHELLPRVFRLAPQAERTVLRMSEAVRQDAELLDELAAEARANAPVMGDGIDASYLRGLREPILRRVLLLLYRERREERLAHIPLEHTHLLAISRLLASGRPSFCYAVPCRLFAVCRDGAFFFTKHIPCEASVTAKIPLSEGENLLPGGFTVTVKTTADSVLVRCFSILHKLDIEAAISPAIINGGMYCRGRLPGDAYAFRGHTHSVKKLYNEQKIPMAVRPSLPILCDDDGILWIPHFPVREKK